MEFVDGDTAYDVPVARYELHDLSDLDHTVETVSSIERMENIVEETGSCLRDADDPRHYLEKFRDAGDIHFYDLDGEGYARAVETRTSEGDALAVDAVKTVNSLDQEAFRAGVNSIFRHAEDMKKDLVMGGNCFFMNGPGGFIDLAYDDEYRVAPASVTFFGEVVEDDELQVGEVKDFDRGETWDEQDQYFVRWL
jgi:hypothetical protein